MFRCLAVVAFALVGCLGVVGAQNPTVRLQLHLGHSDSVYSVAFSPDGRWVLTGSSNKTARLWEAATGAEIRSFEGHSSSVNSVAFSPDGRRVLTGSLDQTARLRDTATGAEIRRFAAGTL